MNIPQNAILVASLAGNANTPILSGQGSGPVLAGETNIWAIVGGNVSAPVPLGLAQVYHADTAGPALPVKTAVVLTQTVGGRLAIHHAAGYTGKTAAQLAAQGGWAASF
jgi:hypothetical protein